MACSSCPGMRATVEAHGPSQTWITRSVTCTSTWWPAAALPRQICCHDTEITPLLPARRATQSSPVRSCTGVWHAAAGPARSRRANRSIGGTIPIAECGRCGGCTPPTHASSSACAVARSAKTRSVRNSVRSVRWNRSTFPVGGRRPGLGQPVGDPVLPADPVEQHLHRRLVEPAGEHLPVVGQDLLGHPVGPHRQRQPVTDPLAVSRNVR